MRGWRLEKSLCEFLKGLSNGVKEGFMWRAKSCLIGDEQGERVGGDPRV